MTDPEGDLDFRPTHVVPQEGLAAWEAPDVSRPTARLDPFLPVQLLSRRGEWGEVLCSNGWSAWVDGRLLVAVPQPPPTTGGQVPGRAEDARPLLQRSADALERYRRAVDDLAAGRAGTEGFRRSVRGLRAGVVLDGEAVWIYDQTAGRWLYDDGTRLSTYAVLAGPGAPSGPERGRAEADADADGATEVRTGQPPAGPAAGRPDRAVPHDPTRIVDPNGLGSDRAVPHDPTRIVDPNGLGSDGAVPHDPTRIVDPHRRGSDRAGEDDPTRIVDPKGLGGE